MSGIPMTATARQIYGGKAILVGEKFIVANEAEAADLLAVRMATRDKVAVLLQPPPAATVAPVVVTRDAAADEYVESSDPTETETEGKTDVSKQQGYNRRDIRAKR
jgi:hypothetical protein